MAKAKKQVSYTAVCTGCGRLIADGEGVVKERKHYCEGCAMLAIPEAPALIPPAGALKVLCYLVSLLPLAGFILGAVFYPQKVADSRAFGRNCFIMMGVGLVMMLVFMLVMAALGAAVGSITEGISLRETYF